MVIHGRERHFLLTVGASAEISEYCPDGDLSRLGEVFDQPYGKQMRAVAKIVAVLSRGYENAQKFADNGYNPCPMTVEEILSLDTATYQELTKEAMSAFTASVSTTIETKSAKKAEAAE